MAVPNEINVRDLRATQAPPASAAPPHDEEAETSVLGAIMLAPRWLDALVVDVKLTPTDFYRPRHRLIFEAMLALSENGGEIDTQLVASKLEDHGVLEEAGGRDYVETLVEGIPAIGNTMRYGEIVKSRSQLRGLLRATQQIQESIAQHDGSPSEIMDQAQQRVYEVAMQDHRGEMRPLEVLLHDELEGLETRMLNGSPLTGTPTGLREVDLMTGGLQPGNLIVLAARPAMGKSALAVNIAENAASAGFPVGVFSLEMSTSELTQRIIASRAKMNSDALRRGKVSKDQWPKIMKASDELAKLPLWVDDSSDLSIAEIRSKARRMNGRFQNSEGRGLGLIVVDYLQLLRPPDPGADRVAQVGQISRGLKILARELKVPIIAVAQLSRAVEQRNPPRPQLSDLRESGQIEADADVIGFIYRDEYYNPKETEKPGIAELIFAKNRHGGVGEIDLTFIKHYPKFTNAPKGMNPADVTPAPGEEFDF